jgi:GNAT superfamily N-acetyltransferase
MTEADRHAAMRIRVARPDDLTSLWGMIGDLADYERLAGSVRGDARLLAEGLFGQRAAEALIAEADGEAVGYAVFFPTFSTFECRSGLWIEDLFVKPARRGQGIGRALLGHVAGLAVERGCARLEWSALDWNEPALRFYEALGATPLEKWRALRLDGQALRSLGTEQA